MMISIQDWKQEISFPAKTCNIEYFKTLQIIKSISNYGACTYIDSMIIKSYKLSWWCIVNTYFLSTLENSIFIISQLHTEVVSYHTCNKSQTSSSHGNITYIHMHILVQVTSFMWFLLFVVSLKLNCVCL